MSSLLQLSLSQLVATQQSLGYPVFTRGEYNLNLVAVRSRHRDSNRFDDAFYVYYRVKGVWKLHSFPCTTDPGLTYLRTPFSEEARRFGEAIVAEGHYPKVWRLCFFRGKPSLCQVAPIRVYRDRNWDPLLDLDPSTITVGLYGIHLHPHFQSMKRAQQVANSSAGCIVLQDLDDHTYLIHLCRISARTFGDLFSFTLLHEDQIVSEPIVSPPL